MRRVGVLLLGVFSYTLFLGVFLYAVAFIGNLGLSRSLDSPSRVALPLAIAIDIGLLVLFALQHSVMARGGFKRLVHRFLPMAAERSLYVLCTNLVLVVLFACWQPIDVVVWSVGRSGGKLALQALFAAGWLIVLVTTFLISHFDLFGLRQTWHYFRGRDYEPLAFVTPGPYRWVRHPLYIGWLIVFWAAPLMTLGHLAFALGLTVYILVAIRFEERDLLDAYGETYARYREEVPMLIPAPPRSNSPLPATD
jgi:protein-S-isoprenylcysteine O-methyltransferase Ste14